LVLARETSNRKNLFAIETGTETGFLNQYFDFVAILSDRNPVSLLAGAMLAIRPKWPQ
jgi:hypothetical protein